MGWIIERWTTIRSALGHRRYLLPSFFGSAVAGYDWAIEKSEPTLTELGMSDLIGVPSWVIGLWVALLLVLWLVVEHAAKLQQQIRGTTTELARLRAQGVDIRNTGIASFATEKDFEEWKVAVLDWNNRVISEIRKINEGDAEWFAILDVVPEPRIKQTLRALPDEKAVLRLQEQARLYRFHDFRVERLGSMIETRWRREHIAM